jgi:hypothetical protein
MPSAPGIAESTPSPASQASSSALMTRTSRPMRSISATNSGPLLASRTAAVATVRTELTPMCFKSSLKRLRAARARSQFSAAMAPVSPTLRPRPASTFSLKIGVGTRWAPE